MHETFHSYPDGTPLSLEDCPIYAAWDGEVHRSSDEVFAGRHRHARRVYEQPDPENGDLLVGAVVAFRDITQRKRIEEEIRISTKVWEAGRRTHRPVAVREQARRSRCEKARPDRATVSYRVRSRRLPRPAGAASQGAHLRRPPPEQVRRCPRAQGREPGAHEGSRGCTIEDLSPSPPPRVSSPPLKRCTKTTNLVGHGRRFWSHKQST